MTKQSNGFALITGASLSIGAVYAERLAERARRDGLQRGLVTLCIGGGRGISH
jgi:acetyl-CoA acetyltransferase